jgi:hypothetical protein
VRPHLFQQKRPVRGKETFGRMILVYRGSVTSVNTDFLYGI